MNQRLVRFDVRLEKGDYVDEFWVAEQRERFLLRPDVKWPLSVDPLVWPSVFYSEVFRQATAPHYASIEVSATTDDGQYWLNLERMRDYYETYKKPGSRGILVGIEMFSENSLADDTIPYETQEGIQCALPLGRTVPAKRPSVSELLGYDVADDSWISGLTNCEYSPEERQRLQRLWASRLNEFGLLACLEDAVQFRELSDARVPEHAPFWIYGIWRMPVSR